MYQTIILLKKEGYMNIFGYILLYIYNYT